MIFPRSLALVAVLTGSVSSVLGAAIQNPHLVLPPSAAAHRAAVVKIFTTSYSAYKSVFFWKCQCRN